MDSAMDSNARSTCRGSISAGSATLNGHLQRMEMYHADEKAPERPTQAFDPPIPSGARQNSLADGEKSRSKMDRFLASLRWTCWHVLTYSWMNILLIFVPAGIAAAQIEGIPRGAVFALNCVAVIPLAALLAHATESVASEMGDALGALMNVTFGNAVELIIL